MIKNRGVFDHDQISEGILKLHLLPILGDTCIDKITTAHVQDVIAATKKKTHARSAGTGTRTSTPSCIFCAGFSSTPIRRLVLREPPFAREKLPVLPEASVQNELTAAERHQLLASFEDEQGFREHLGKVMALNTKKKIFKASTEYGTYYYERFRWSHPLFTAAFFTGLRFTATVNCHSRGCGLKKTTSRRFRCRFRGCESVRCG